MADRKPRIAVTLSDEDRDLVQRLAVIEGTQPSKVVANIVAEFRPILKQLVQLGEAMGSVDDAQRAKLAALAEAMETGVLPQSNEVLTAFQDALNAAREIVTK